MITAPRAFIAICLSILLLTRSAVSVGAAQPINPKLPLGTNSNAAQQLAISAPIPSDGSSLPASAGNSSDRNDEHSVYVLGRGDQLMITDYSGQDLHHAFNTQTVTILPDGTASIYPVGIIRAAGKTLSQLNELINEKAKEYIYSPQLLITLSRPRPVSVYVLGEVQNPGVYTLGVGTSQSNASNNQSQSSTPPMNLSDQGLLTGSVSLPDTGGLSSPETYTVLSALQKAGGLKEKANVRSIKVTRSRSNQVFFVDLWRLLVNGDADQDLELEARDVIFVRRGGIGFDPSEFGRLAASQTRAVRIWGSVKSPGLYELGPHDDVLSIIAKAGGFTPTANKSSVLLSRVNADGTVIKKKISIGRSLKDEGVGRSPVQAGDVVIVSESLLLASRQPLLFGALAIGGAMLVLYVSARTRNINVQNNSNPNNTNVRVAIPSL